MRILVLMKNTGKHYICTKIHPVDPLRPRLMEFEMLFGGKLSTTFQDVETVETYEDDEIEQFRRRLKELGEK